MWRFTDLTDDFVSYLTIDDLKECFIGDEYNLNKILDLNIGQAFRVGTSVYEKVQ